MLSCYQFHGNTDVFGKGALQELSFSSFEARASKTCEPPIKTTISMHVVTGLVSTEVRNREALSVCYFQIEQVYCFNYGIEEVKDHFQILSRNNRLSCLSLTNRGAFLFAVEKGSSSLMAHQKME